MDDPHSEPPADLALVGCTALIDAETGPVRFATSTTIEILDGRITALRPDADGPPRAREIIDATGLVAMPGLVNTHCHAAMTLLRGAAEDVTIADWFNDRIWPMEVNLTATDVRLGSTLAALEMIESGVTTVADHYFFMDDAAEAFAASGMRADLGWAFFGSQGREGLERSTAFVERWHGAADGRITASLAPHAPYTCSDDDLAAAADAARRLGVRVHVHAAEDDQQTASSLESRGISPIEVLERTGVLDAGAVIAHGNGILPADVETLARHRDRVGITHGPKGYLKFGMRTLTPLRDLLDAGVPVGYCTDGAASNSTLDVFESMRVTALAQKHVAGDARWFTSAAALAMAGPGSAAVLGRRGELGVLTPGALADVILVDVSGAHCQPVHDLAAALVYSVRASDVRTTVVAGRVVMRDREVLTIDREAVLAAAARRAVGLADRSHGRSIQDYAP